MPPWRLVRPPPPPPLAPLPPPPLLLVLLVLVQAAFSGYTIVVTLTVVHEHLNPVVFSLFRDVGGGTVLLAASRWTYGSWHAPLKEDIGWCLLVGVRGVYVGQMFMVFALFGLGEDHP